MNDKKKARRARRDAQQEKQAQLIINWIFGILVLAAFLFLIVQMIA